MVTPVSQEFVGAKLGDERLSRRLLRIVDAAERAPGASLPERAGSSAALEGTYRFFSNEKVAPEAVFGAHAAATVQRAAAEPEVLIIHDTTEFRFGGEKPRQGMGRLNSNARDGFLAHYSICATPTGRPLGTLGRHAWVRQGAIVGRPRARDTSLRRDPDRESHRWQDAALLTGEMLHDKTNAIHVMDREGDQFELLSALVEHSQRFVVRLAHDRRLEPGRGRTVSPRLFESLATCEFFFEREVELSARGSSTGSNKSDVYPVRKTRRARLEVRAGTREVFAVHSAAAHVPRSLTLQIVEVREVDAPDNEKPIIWRLVTTERVDTKEQVAAIVDAYRTRWLIEEFFKALKTGCRFQQLQLESIHGLLVALSIESAVSWRLLMLRWVSRHEPDADATTVLPPEHISVLVALTAAETGRRLPRTPSVRVALFEIARLGGHIKNNGDPGWLVLSRGFDKLLTIHRGWALAQIG